MLINRQLRQRACHDLILRINEQKQTYDTKFRKNINNSLAKLSSYWTPRSVVFIAFGCVRATSSSCALAYPFGEGRSEASKKRDRNPKLSWATAAIAFVVAALVIGFSGENARVPSFLTADIFPLH